MEAAMGTVGAAAAERILRAALAGFTRSALARGAARVQVDRRYILYAMGLLGGKYPSLARKLLKREFQDGDSQ
jgi:hypothetical protein